MNYIKMNIVKILDIDLNKMNNFDYKKYLAEGKLLKEEEGTYRVYMNSDPDEPERIDYERYFGDGTKAEMIKQAKKMAYSNDPTNQYGDPILVKVTHEDDIDDVAWTNVPVNEGITRADFYKQIEKEAFTAGWDSYEENANVEDAFNRFSSQQDAAQEEPKSYAKGGGSDFIDPMGLRESVNENIQDNQWTAYVKSLINDIRLNGVEQYTGFREDDILEDFENYIADKF